MRDSNEFKTLKRKIDAALANQSAMGPTDRQWGEIKTAAYEYIKRKNRQKKQSRTAKTSDKHGSENKGPVMK